MKTTREVAEQYGITISRVVQLARDRGIEPAKQVGPAFLWSAAQVANLKPNRPGRPAKKGGSS